ncbi:hypothetical protein A0H81_01608 [Grifola frondosa]|uniref:BRCT domain-containing protein n=1 Tax=Grifola frondosa TaxID=5627 RepID=A0A1C7MP68_GRIFR|nr:hypothetical protein A0H81_01608 [Grifola frondosa]
MAKGHPNNDRRGSLKRKLNEESSEDEANETAKGQKSRNMVKIDTEGAAMKASSTRANPKTIKIMTTQALTRMGAKMTSKPAECTHLIAPNLVRTEKFLCAMPVAPFIVTGKWAVMSAAGRQFLPEADYVPADPENEKKFGFKLTDALHRAKTNGEIFTGMTFYMTPKVPIAKLLRNVVSFCFAVPDIPIQSQS